MMWIFIVTTHPFFVVFYESTRQPVKWVIDWRSFRVYLACFNISASFCFMNFCYSCSEKALWHFDESALSDWCICDLSGLRGALRFGLPSPTWLRSIGVTTDLGVNFEPEGIVRHLHQSKEWSTLGFILAPRHIRTKKGTFLPLISQSLFRTVFPRSCSSHSERCPIRFLQIPVSCSCICLGSETLGFLYAEEVNLDRFFFFFLSFTLLHCRVRFFFPDFPWFPFLLTVWPCVYIRALFLKCHREEES